MLAGIGVTIALAQLHIVLGGSPQPSAPANVLALPGQLARLHPGAVAVSAAVVAVLLLWPRLPGRTGHRLRRIPAALAAMALATAAAWALDSPGGAPLARVDLPSWRGHALPGLPHGTVAGLAAAVLTVTLVASVQSLLSAVAVDRLAASRSDDRAALRPDGRAVLHPDGRAVPRSDLDKELRGQGVANVVSGALGGLPVAGVAVRSTANVRSGAVSRNSAVLHGVWVLAACALLTGALELIPLAALAALVMAVGVQMVRISHVRSVLRHRELPVYAVTVAGVVLSGVLEGVAAGVVVAAAVALRRVARTRITHEVRADGSHRVRVRGQLTFLAVPRLSRVLAQVPARARAEVELAGSFIDHAAYEALQHWRTAHACHGGTAALTSSTGRRIAEPGTAHACRPWTPWRNHACVAPPPGAAEPSGALGHPLLGGVSNFQRTTAPLVREELARLAREGQRPTQLFLTCADSRLVTSMITSSGPGDLFTVRNIGNLVPPPDGAPGDDSVAAAIEYAVDVLRVGSVTVCGHSGCGAMQALLEAGPGLSGDGDAPTPLLRWLRHGAPSLELVRRAGPRIAERPHADAAETLSLANVVQQLDHLRAHACVARRVAEGTLTLHGMYFHVGEAQAYVLDGLDGRRRSRFTAVGGSLGRMEEPVSPTRPQV